MKCVLVGNYGVGNLGDEALKEYFLSAFPDIQWSVVSACPQPGEYSRLPTGIRSLFTPWWTTIRTMSRADAVIFGGGSLFTDAESVFACFLWSFHALPAIILRKTLYLTFQGIGPFRTRMGEKLTRWTISHAAFLSVRDEESMMRVRTYKMDKNIIQTFDPVFLSMEKQKIEGQIKNVFVVIPRKNSNKSLQNIANKTLSDLGGNSAMRILSMQPDDVDEKACCERLLHSLGDRGEIVPVRTLTELMTSVSDASLVVTERFHGALAALAAEIPVRIIPQAKRDKLSELQLMIENGFDRQEADRRIKTGYDALRQALMQ